MGFSGKCQNYVRIMSGFGYDIGLDYVWGNLGGADSCRRSTGLMRNRCTPFPFLCNISWGRSLWI